MRTPEISEAPAAIALVGADGAIERVTALFLDRCGDDDDLLAPHQREVERLLAGDRDRFTIVLAGAAADISAVIASDGDRYGLLTIALPSGGASSDGGTPLMDAPIDASPAIVWLKDLEGRYLRVNDRYVEQLQVDAERVLGKADDQLAPGESIEGLRLLGGEVAPTEPLELEYTVAAVDDRPAFAVLRFALRDGEGKPSAVCGVAAPLARADVARSECERLMRLEQWSRSDESAVRGEVLAEWGLALVAETAEPLPDWPDSDDQSTEREGDHFAAIAAELDAALSTSARLDRELAEERRQAMALREASILAARRAHELLGTVRAERARSAELEDGLARAEARVTELEHERDSERLRAERAEAGAAEAVAQEQQITETARLELASAEDELERLKSAVSAAPTADQLESERVRAHEAALSFEQAQAELATTSAALAREQRTVQTMRAELRASEEETERARRAASEAIAQAPTHEELEQERRRADQANTALAQARVRAEQAQAEKRSALSQAHAELRRVHAEAAEASAALHAERQTAESLRAELTAAQAELEGTRQAAAEASHPPANEEQRSRAEHAAAETKAALAQAVDELARTRLEAAASSAALAAEQQSVEMLRAELNAARGELGRARHAAVEPAVAGPTLEDLHRERERAARAEAAMVEERLLAEQSIASSEQARRDASAAVAAADAERQVLDALRLELSHSREELDELRRQASAEVPAAAVADAEPVAAGEDSPGRPVWDSAAQRALSAALIGISEWRLALRQAVNVLGAQGRWDAVVAWQPDDRGKVMKCAAMWTADAARLGGLETKTWQHRRKFVVGGTAHTGEVPTATYRLDLETGEDALLKAAAADGMGSALLVPISDGTQTAGMLELLSCSTTAPDPELILSLEGIALQLCATAQQLDANKSPHWRVGRL